MHTTLIKYAYINAHKHKHKCVHTTTYISAKIARTYTERNITHRHTNSSHISQSEVSSRINAGQYGVADESHCYTETMDASINYVLYVYND